MRFITWTLRMCKCYNEGVDSRRFFVDFTLEGGLEYGKMCIRDRVLGEFQQVEHISASLQKRLLENGMPVRLLESLVGKEEQSA